MPKTVRYKKKKISGSFQAQKARELSDILLIQNCLAVTDHTLILKNVLTVSFVGDGILGLVFFLGHINLLKPNFGSRSDPIEEFPGTQNSHLLFYFQNSRTQR